ncbi:YvrJ family protein [uncultured Clostridium sp.]|uniref:YvrJ family protein n=1 Tax=uncultured Clostridium sp. TaxID=59620 RepID=UPI0025EA8B3E|nr:YvrJ family protein [uncultured Clostridium sp.]
MEVNELINLVVNNGFPVAVSCYLLIRLEKQLSSLSASINKLNTIISAKLGVVIDSDNMKDNNGSGNVA